MADQNQNLSDYLSQYNTSQTAAPPAASSSLDSYLSQYTSSAPSPAAPSAPVAAAPSDNPLGSYLSKYTQPSPETGQPETPTEHIYQDSSQPWYKRAWDLANTPITESLFGMPESREGAGGFERAGEKILSGLTSPLSLVLTAATFGTGGLIESAGANLLKASGEFGAEQLPTIIKASEAALQATKDLKPIEPAINSALEAKGGTELVDLVNKAKNALGPIDLSSRFGEDAVQTALSKTGEFTEDQLGQLANASKTVQEAKQGFTPVEDAVKAAVGDDGYNTWKQAQEVLYNNGLTEHDLLGGNALERGAFHIIKNTVPTTSYAVATRMAKTANTLLSAGFTYQQLETAAAMSPRFLDALKEGDWEAAKEYGTEAAVGAGLGILGTHHALNAAGELFKPLLETDKFRPNDQWLALERSAKERDVQHALADSYAQKIDTDARKILGHEGAQTPEQKLQLASVFHHVVTGGDADKAAAWYNALSEAAGRDERIPLKSPVIGLPENLSDQIRTQNFTKTTPEYQNLILDSLKRVANGELSDKELAAAKQLRDEDANNYQLGSANNILHSWIPDHMTRIYKDENPDGRIVLSNAKQGKFATNVSMARHQVYDSHLTALLKSPKEIVMDPVYSVAQGRAALVRAAANRQFIDDLRDKFTRASDGRPAVVLSGAGRVVSGPEGQDPKTFIDPNRLRKINIADSVVEQLRKTGDLDRYLEDGTIRDLTPQVFPDTLDQTISRLSDRMSRLKDENLLAQTQAQLAELQQAKSLAGEAQSEALKAYNAKQKPIYAWDPQDYVSLDHPSMKDWKYATADPSGNPVFVNSDIKVHPEFADYIKNRLGIEPSELQKHPVSRSLLGAGTKLKETLLSLSPFHMVQIALRGIMTGVNPFTLGAPDLIDGAKIDPANPNSPTILKKLVEQGYTTGTDYRALQEHSEGVSSGGGLIKAIPFIGKPISNSLNWYQDFLFKRYIPAIKATAAEHMFREYQNLHPDWSVDRAAKAAALHANNTFGGINWRAMGRSATTQDWGRIFLLAPDWLESELRSGAQLFHGDERGLTQAQVAKMAMGLWGIARVLNLATTGNAHYESPFGIAIKNKEGKETIYGIRTLPTDLLHAASDPAGFIKGRLSPSIRLGQEILTQRDQFGRKLSPQDVWVDSFRNILPIPVQSIGQALTGTGPEVGNIGQVVKAVGGTAQTYYTPAQKLAADLASNHSEDGLVDPAQMARHRAIMQIEDRLRSGEIQLPELYKMTYQDNSLKESELKKVLDNYKATRGLDPAMASLYARASRLPAPEYFQLLDTANPSEKTALLPLTKKVMRRYITKVQKDMTPQERQTDPLLNRILRMLPQMENQPSNNQE